MAWKIRWMISLVGPSARRTIGWVVSALRKHIRLIAIRPTEQKPEATNNRGSAGAKNGASRPQHRPNISLCVCVCVQPAHMCHYENSEVSLGNQKREIFSNKRFYDSNELASNLFEILQHSIPHINVSINAAIACCCCAVGCDHFILITHAVYALVMHQFSIFRCWCSLYDFSYCAVVSNGHCDGRNVISYESNSWLLNILCWWRTRQTCHVRLYICSLRIYFVCVTWHIVDRNDANIFNVSMIKFIYVSIVVVTVTSHRHFVIDAFALWTFYSRIVCCVI